ncbi:MAG TPA: methyltransferase domain-containing protein [Bryobacteraceae bacterium]|jgi:SAM-dependent methyltransferase|nr:methyltransferase domain-containing protein [Bryobacteraceae bacterium]
MHDYAARLSAEDRHYRDDTDVHSLPDIFHYWSNCYVRPKLEAFGFPTPEAMFGKYLGQQFERQENHPKRFVSFGSGNCNLEIDLALHLQAHGHSQFIIDCVDLNPSMLERGRASAVQREVAAHLNFVQADFNAWTPEHEYDAVIANQALHHVLKLEDLFGRIKSSLRPRGSLIVSELVGRNGHQRWPEALHIVHEFWRKLPPSYRFNRKLQRYEELYLNYDCSLDGFEGIRSQDILPLLLQNFHFDVFVAFANVIEPFVDRAFGYNFDSQAQWDRSFIDAVHQRDEQEFASGHLKPTHILAVLGRDPSVPTLYHPPLTPDFCVRETSKVIEEPGEFRDAYDWRSWPHDPQTELEIACQRLEAADRKLKEAQDQVDERGEMVERLMTEVEERTQWALRLKKEIDDYTGLDLHLQQLNKDVEERTAWALKLNDQAADLNAQFEERTAWALELDRLLEARTAQTRELTKALEQLAWARPLDRRFHKFLTAAVHALSRLRNR